MRDINEKIEFNNNINERIDQIEKDLEFEENKLASKLAGASSDTSKEAKKIIGKKDGKSKSKIANKMLDKTDDRKISKMRDDIVNGDQDAIKLLYSSMSRPSMPSSLSNLIMIKDNFPDFYKHITTKLDVMTVEEMKKYILNKSKE